MTLKRTLVTLANVIADEVARNPEFRERIEAALDIGKQAPKQYVKGAATTALKEDRKGGRRAPAVLDPIELVKHSEQELRERLSDLNLEKLLDVVAQYGMDPGKLVMKWKDRDRVIDRIVEVAASRATKGDAFRHD